MEDITKTKTTSKLIIEDAKLYIRHVKPTTDILSSHERLLLRGEMAVYEYKRGEIITQNIAAGSSNIQINNFYSGPKPSLIVFGMLTNKAYTGDRATNPFAFHHFNLRSFHFSIDGTHRPQNSYDVIIDETHNCYAHIFAKLYESIGYHNSDRSNLVTHANFIENHFLILEDLSNFNLALTDINEPLRNVNIGVNAVLAKPLTENITCMLYMLIPSRFEIGSNRQVIPIM